MGRGDNIQVFLERKAKPEQLLKVRKQLSCSERGKRYVLQLKEERLSSVFQVDGELVKEGNRCDKLVLLQTDIKVDKWSEVFIELKGVDVNHAINQLASSLLLDLFMHASVEKKYARIVAASIPSHRNQVEMERAKVKFKRDFDCELKTLKSDQPDRL